MYWLRFEEAAIRELKAIRSADRRRLIDQIEMQLGKQPLMTSRRKKTLFGIEPPWEQVRPVWQLRLGDYRVFYDVDEETREVTVRAVRRKGRKTTEEIL